METIVLALGSNLGDRSGTIEDAYYKIEKRCGRIVRRSSMYETAPEGFISDDLFLNSAIIIQSELDALSLLAELNSIESELGRKRAESGEYISRTIDIDIIFYGGEIIHSPELTIPHPRFRERLFVLEPINEIAAEWKDPISGLSINLLYQYLKNRSDN